VRIIWNTETKAFQAVLTAGEQWQSDLEAVKLAGFKTTGPPAWQWYTTKPSVLNKLRDNKPKSGLTLTEVALEQYKPLNEKEQQVLALKKQFQKEKKAAEKQSLDSSISGMVEVVIPDKGYIDASDLPASGWKHKFDITPMHSIDKCIICEDPLAFYEQTICLWCGKEQNERTA
jgi:hypothetical protein